MEFLISGEIQRKIEFVFLCVSFCKEGKNLRYLSAT